jgi:hypothetical protein
MSKLRQTLSTEKEEWQAIILRKMESEIKEKEVLTIALIPRFLTNSFEFVHPEFS